MDIFGFVYFIVHTDCSFIQLIDDFLKYFDNFRGTTLALFDAVLREEYKNENNQSFSPIATVDDIHFLRVKRLLHAACTCGQ
jgi:hypothetical protein